MFKLPSGNFLSADTETTGLNWRKGDRPYCFTFCNAEGETAILSFPVNPKTRKVDYRLKPGSSDSNVNVYALPFPILREAFEDPKRVWIFHNAVFDIGMLKGIGIIVKGKVLDTMILIRLVRSDAPLALKKFCKQYLDIPDDDETLLKEKTREARRVGKKNGWMIHENSIEADYWLAGKEYYEPYAIRDAERCMLVYKTLYPELIKMGLQKQWDTEVKTWKVLRKIENRGIRVFRDKVLLQKESVKKKKLEFTDQIYRIVPKKTNLNSSLQLRKIFFSDLKISPTFLTKNGNPSTDTDALRSINHPLARMILNVRACNKTTEFMDQYLNFMVQHKDGNWYLHPTFHQSIAVTGRESCNSPNLQQVASGESDKGADIMVEARNVFGPRENYVWRSYDWKNIEVYIPSFCSGDSKLTAILRAGGDVHQSTADSLTRRLGRSISRFQGKRTFFGLQYGIGRVKLAKTLGTDVETAIYIREAFDEEYPGLCEWMEKLRRQVIRDGYITTQYGIRKYLGQQESYKAINYFVQGTASSILKNAKIKIYDRLKEKEWKAHIVLPVHDELIIEIRKDQDINLIDRHVVICMQDNPELKMPISIPVSISAIQNNWAEKQKIKVV